MDGRRGAPSKVDPRLCLYDRADVVARGFMRWFPLMKRGLLEDLE